MKTGKTLTQLAQEIERQRETRVDFIAPTDKLAMEVAGVAENPVVVMAGLIGGGLTERPTFNQLGHRQLGSHVGVPAPYYDRMLANAPELLAANVNHWLHAKPEKRMVRTLDGKVRAFLSDAYRPLDNHDLAEAVLPVLLDQDLDIVSCEITERRLYIKAVDKRLQRDVPSGHKMGDGTHTIFDTCSPYALISNSEVGEGSLKVESGVWTRACTNLAIFSQRALRKYHTGARHEIADGLAHLLTDETRKATDKAVWLQVRDVVRGAFDEAKFDASLDELRGLAAQPIVSNDIAKVVDLAARTLDIKEMEKPSILRHLAEGGDLTRYGLFNAITRTAEDLDDYDRSTDFERMGGKVIDLSPTEWKRIAEAA